ncbi:unnamed protein product [Sphenostylis stenocarpa]|uniref:Uncharacterized protein n=1 Tax=Sphenostylis stenocarpa TaxID=92480 RepID=A0AA86SWQ4_9FABA|nr:unnamed protein product [Sphenostylis stenocarpa]
MTDQKQQQLEIMVKENIRSLPQHIPLAKTSTMACNHPPPPPLQRNPLPTVPETPDIEERQLKRDVSETDDEGKCDFADVHIVKEEKAVKVVVVAEEKPPEIKKMNPRKRKAVTLRI